MALVAEKDLVVGVEYYLDRGQDDKGIFVKSDQGLVFFKITAGNCYGGGIGSVTPFSQENYSYETV